MPLRRGERVAKRSRYKMCVQNTLLCFASRDTHARPSYLIRYFAIFVYIYIYTQERSILDSVGYDTVLLYLARLFYCCSRIYSKLYTRSGIPTCIIRSEIFTHGYSLNLDPSVEYRESRLPVVLINLLRCIFPSSSF